MDSSIIQITSLDFYFWIKPPAILQNIIILIMTFFWSVFLTYHFEDRILYSQTSPKQPLWGPKKVAVVERWSLWGGGGVIWQFLYCHQRTIWIKFPDHSWLVCQSLKNWPLWSVFWQLGTQCSGRCCCREV